MRQVRLPKHIDAPGQIALWEIDELFPLAAIFGLGIMFKQLMIAILAMYVVNKIYKKFKYSALEGRLLHLCYWWGLVKITSKLDNGQARYYGS